MAAIAFILRRTIGAIYTRLFRQKKYLPMLMLAALWLGVFYIFSSDRSMKWKLFIFPFSNQSTECCNSGSLSNESFAVVHSNLDPNSTLQKIDVAYVLVLPFSWTTLYTDGNLFQEFTDSDRQTLLKMGEFLHARKEFDAAACQQMQRSSSDTKRESGKNDTKNDALESSWCRFARRNWSIQIRNTGPVIRQQFLFPTNTKPSDSVLEDAVEFQNCNIVQGPFLIRSDIFRRLGGLLNSFGKLNLLEFFIRSNGDLKIAKLKNCWWSHKITRVDRGPLEKSPDFPEYAFFGNKHKILRIITENRIEWTACVANWKMCPGEPYVASQGLPSTALQICCSVVLGQLLDDMTWALNNVGIEYRLVYGTLLGAVRSQAIIPWTRDVDFAITESHFEDVSTYTALEDVLGARYFVGEFSGMPRAVRHLAPHIEIDTTPFFEGPHDLQGDKFFSSEVEEAVKGMLPVLEHWNYLGYIVFYNRPPEWMSDSSNVTIDGKTFVTVKDVHKELNDSYGNSYMIQAMRGNWSGRD